MNISAPHKRLPCSQENRIIYHTIAEIDVELVGKCSHVSSNTAQRLCIEFGLTYNYLLHIREPKALKEHVVFLDISATCVTVYACHLVAKGKKRGKNGDDHDAIVSRGVFIVRLQELIGDVENSRLFVRNEFMQSFIDPAANYDAKLIDLLGHKMTKLLVQCTTLQVIFLEDKVAIAAFNHHHFYLSCFLREKTTLIFVLLLHLYVLDSQLYFLALWAHLLLLLAPAQLILVKHCLLRVVIIAYSHHLVDSLLADGLEGLEGRLKPHFPKDNTLALIFLGERGHCFSLWLVTLLGEIDWLIFVLKSTLAAVKRAAVLGGSLIIQQFLQSELVYQYLPECSHKYRTALKCFEYISFDLLLDLLLVQIFILVNYLDDIVIVDFVKSALRWVLLQFCFLHLFKFSLQVCSHGLVDPIINRSLCLFWSLVKQIGSR